MTKHTHIFKKKKKVHGIASMPYRARICSGFVPKITYEKHLKRVLLSIVLNDRSSTSTTLSTKMLSQTWQCSI